MPSKRLQICRFTASYRNTTRAQCRLIHLSGSIYYGGCCYGSDSHCLQNRAGQGRKQAVSAKTRAASHIIDLQQQQCPVSHTQGEHRWTCRPAPHSSGHLAAMSYQNCSRSLSRKKEWQPEDGKRYKYRQAERTTKPQNWCVVWTPPPAQS